MRGFTKLEIPEFSNTKNPPVAFHFAVVFLAGGVVPNPLDMRFQKVSGIQSEINTMTINEGGENLYAHRLPTRVSYNNLVLERGMVLDSPLSIEFEVAMSTLKFSPSNVLVALLDDNGDPATAWLFYKAYPVKWSMSDFDATNNSIVVETMELAYTRYQTIRI